MTQWINGTKSADASDPRDAVVYNLGDPIPLSKKQQKQPVANRLNGGVAA